MEWTPDVEEFIAEHAVFVAPIFSIMSTIIVVLGLALIRIKFGRIDGDIGRHEIRLADHEGRISALEGDNRISNNDIGHLSKLLETYVKDIKKALDNYVEHNDREHQEIKSLIRRELQAQGS